MAGTSSDLPSSRDVVLEAAQELISEYGYAGLSMRELAKQSGIAKATIYHHFQDKREIYLRVLERDILVVCERFAQAAGSPGDLRDKLRSVILTYFALQNEHRFVLMSALRETASMQSELCSLVRKHRAELMRPLADIIANGVAEGTIKPVNVEMTVVSLLGMLHSFVTHRILLDHAIIEEDVVDHILDLLLFGITLVSPQAAANDRATD
jgi:TetR/AcrR family transcriptional regulator, cholesterol catabolism regulator